MPERDQTPAIAQHFGDNLRRVRRRKDLSQERFARLAGLHRTEIGFLEKGERVCRIDTLVRLAGALSVPAAELPHGIDWIPGPSPGGTYDFRFDATARSEPTR